MSHFATPVVRSSEEWGPSDSIPERFQTLPVQFSNVITNKGGVHLGRVADWTQEPQTSYYQQQQQKEVKQATQQELGPDLEDFSLVSGTKQIKHHTLANKRRPYGPQVPSKGQFQRGPTRTPTQRGAKLQRGRNQQPWNNWDQRKGSNPTQNKNSRALYKSSVQIKPTWEPLTKFTFANLSKLASVQMPVGEDVKKCGYIDPYDRKYDRLNTKSAVTLTRQVVQQRAFFNVTTSEDPIINSQEVQDKGNVFATDVILSALMNTTKAVHSFDVIARKVGDKIWFDKRRHSQLDLVTVNETAKDAPSTEDKDRDHINSAWNLSIEATIINQCFSQQVLQKPTKPVTTGAAPTASSSKNKEERIQFPEPNPFASQQQSQQQLDLISETQSTTSGGSRVPSTPTGTPGATPASVGYRYRAFTFGDNIKLVCRCEVDAAIGVGDKAQFVTAKALNEYESGTKTDWASRLDSQRGTVLVSEYKNNTAKLSRWVTQALLAKTDYMKLGFVSRINAKNNQSHALLGVETTKPEDFVKQFQLNVGNQWAVLKTLIDTIRAQEGDGKYLIVKLPNKQELQLYSIPENEFDREDEEEDDDVLDDDDDMDNESGITGASDDME